MSDTDRTRRPVYEDMRFQEFSWRLQRLGWAALALIAVAALTGVFSHGHWSNAVAQQDGLPLAVHYERFQRISALHRFDISIPAGGEDEIRLSFNKAFSDVYEIDSIQPQPLRANSSNGGIILTFETPERGDFNVVVWARPRSFGRASLEIGTPRGALPLQVLVYP